MGPSVPQFPHCKKARSPALSPASWSDPARQPSTTEHGCRAEGEHAPSPPPRPHAIPLKPGMGGSWSRRTGTPGWTRCLLRGPGTLLGMASPHRRPPGSPGLGSSRGRCWGGLQRSCGGHGLSGLAGGRRASQGGGAVLGSGVQWGAGGSPAASPSKGLSTGEGPLDSAAHTPPPRLATGCVCPVLQEKVAGLPGVRTEGLGRPAEPPLLWPRREPRGLPLTLRLLVSRALDTRSVVALTSTCKGRPARKRRGLAGRRPLWEHCVLGAPQSHGAGGGGCRAAQPWPGPSTEGRGQPHEPAPSPLPGPGTGGHPIGRRASVQGGRTPLGRAGSRSGSCLGSLEPQETPPGPLRPPACPAGTP